MRFEVQKYIKTILDMGEQIHTQTKTSLTDKKFDALNKSSFLVKGEA